MTDILLGFVAGLIVGWNFFPQPAWFKAVLAKFGLGKGKTEINIDFGSSSNTSNTQ